VAGGGQRKDEAGISQLKCLAQPGIQCCDNRLAAHMYVGGGRPGGPRASKSMAATGRG